MPGALAALRTAVSKLSLKILCSAFAASALIAGLNCADAHAAAGETGAVSLGIRNGYIGLTHSNGFHAKFGNTTHKTGSNYTGIYPYVRYNSTENSVVELEYGRERGGGPVLQTITLSGVHMLNYEKEKFRPYLRIGVLLGRLKWPDLPGTFMTGTGWLVGAGAVRAHGRMSYTADISYRGLKFPYEKGAGIIAASDEIDLSGFSLKVGAAIRY